MMHKYLSIECAKYFCLTIDIFAFSKNKKLEQLWKICTHSSLSSEEYCTNFELIIVVNNDSLISF